MAKPLLEVRHLKKFFNVAAGTLHAVDDVTFTIEPGKTLGVVGESGCGKSTTGRAILRLLEPTSGEVIFDGVDVLKLNKKEMRKKRQEMQLIFQDPFSSLNPRMTVSETIEEPLKLSGMIPDKDQRFTRVLELMDRVGLAERPEDRYRQGSGDKAEIYRVRRAGFRSGRIDPGSDLKPDETDPAGYGSYLHVYYP